jgi:polysaccharide export outer membrane protein
MLGARMTKRLSAIIVLVAVTLTVSSAYATPAQQTISNFNVNKGTDTLTQTAKAQTAVGAPEAAISASKEFRIRQGDVLQVTVWKEEGMDQEIIVLPDGTINFPLAGSIRVEGLTPAMAAYEVKEKLSTKVPDASVSVIVKSPLGHTVSVIGQVTKPGDIVMNHPLSVMQVLSQAGGLTPYASTSSIKILRKINGKETVIKFPYDDVSEGDDLEKNITLEPGDVVVVPTAGLF